MVILLSNQRDIYDNCGVEVLSKSESAYRSYVFDESIKSCTRYLRDTGANVTFLPGEIELTVMTRQLKNDGLNDGRFKYNADGLLCSADFGNLEILLTEVSSGFGNSDGGKTSFDHYSQPWAFATA